MIIIYYEIVILNTAI